MLPDNLPVPQDDGAARHLIGLRLPDIALAATDGAAVNLSTLKGRTVVYVYPRTGRPGQALPTGWDAIPGARGCTPQSCGFRDHFAELKRLGVAQLYGLSTQDTAYQREAVERLHLPFAILSDADLKLTRALRAADLRGRRHDADQAHGLGDRRRRDHARVLSGVSAGQERRSRSSPGFRRRDSSAHGREHRAEHFGRQHAGVGVVARAVIAAENSVSAPIAAVRAVAERGRRALGAERLTVVSWAMRPSATMARSFGISAMVGVEKIAAGVDLRRRRLVFRRHAAHGVGDAGIDQFQACRPAAPRIRRGRSRIPSAWRRAGRRRNRR